MPAINSKEKRFSCIVTSVLQILYHVFPTLWCGQGNMQYPKNGTGYTACGRAFLYYFLNTSASIRSVMAAEQVQVDCTGWVNESNAGWKKKQWRALCELSPRDRTDFVICAQDPIRSLSVTMENFAFQLCHCHVLLFPCELLGHTKMSRHTTLNSPCCSRFKYTVRRYSPTIVPI